MPKTPGLGIELDDDKLMEAHETYKRLDVTQRNDVLVKSERTHFQAAVASSISLGDW